MVSGGDKLWRQEVLNPSRLLPFSPSPLSLIVHFPYRWTRSRQTNSDPKYSSNLFFFPFFFSKGFLLACVSPFHHHLTPNQHSICPFENTTRTSTAVFKSANAIMASSKPRLVDTLPSVRTRPMKVIVLGLNRTGTMCMFFFPAHLL